MANKMTKRGTQDNIVTYEHICDTTEDLQNIDPKFITLGSVAVVLEGDGGMEFYMANSNREWLIMTTNTSGGSGGASKLNGLSDVNISSPTAGQFLAFDNSGKWKNVTTKYTINVYPSSNNTYLIPDISFQQAVQLVDAGINNIVLKFRDPTFEEIKLTPVYGGSNITGFWGKGTHLMYNDRIIQIDSIIWDNNPENEYIITWNYIDNWLQPRLYLLLIPTTNPHEIQFFPQRNDGSLHASDSTIKTGAELKAYLSNNNINHREIYIKYNTDGFSMVSGSAYYGYTETGGTYNIIPLYCLYNLHNANASTSLSYLQTAFFMTPTISKVGISTYTQNRLEYVAITTNDMGITGDGKFCFCQMPSPLPFTPIE